MSVSMQPQNTYLENYLASRAGKSLDTCQPCKTLPSNGPKQSGDQQECFSLETFVSELDQLQKLCDNNDVTILSLLKTAWAVILRGYTGNNNVCFGFRSSLGQHSSAIIFNFDLDIDQSLLEETKRVQTSDLSRALDAGHDDDWNVILQQLADIPFKSEMRFSTIVENTHVEMENTIKIPQSVDVSLTIVHSHDRLSICLSYRDSILSTSHAHNIVRLLKSTVLGVLLEPDAVLSQLDFLDDEGKEIIGRWNTSLPLAEDESSSHTIHELFERMVETQPESIAIDSWDGQLTYRQLDEVSMKLASHLRVLGVGRESLVIHCFEKSTWAVVAIIAVLKAGAACVAISPEYPRARIQAIVEDTRAQVALVSWDTLEPVKGLVPHPVILDAKFLEAVQPPEISMPKVDPQQLAFILFTSGSTGVPKGIAIEHAALCFSMLAMGRQLSMNRKSRVLQFSSFTFDAHLFDIFVTLHFGGCVCIPSEFERSNDLTGAINRLKVNILNLTPTVASMIQPGDVPSVSMLIMVGEAVTRAVVQAWSSVSGLRLFNGYGPAETYVASLIEIIPESNSTSSPSNIGFALGGDRFWVVDPLNYNRLMPVGSIGELLIEGSTLARGYLNMPEKTAEVFLTVPISWAHIGEHQDGSAPRRVYKTGDLVRYCPDGSLDYVGRKDAQVKVNGQRVELAEIEYHLNTAAPKATHCAVVQASSGLCQGKLVALVTLSLEGRSPKGSTNEITLIPHSEMMASRSIIQHLTMILSGKVPTYMIPRFWLFAEAIPLTVSGKTNLAAISQWVHNIDISDYNIAAALSSVEDEDQGSTAAETEGELRIQAVWSRVLGLPRELALNRSFISLGGDSVAAMKVVSMLGGKISVKQLLLGKTIRELAATIDEHQQLSPVIANELPESPSILTPDVSDKIEQVLSDSLQLLSPRTPGGKVQPEDIYPCTPMQQAMLIGLAKTRDVYKISYLAEIVPMSDTYSSTGLDVERFRYAWQIVMDRHPALRTIFVHGIADTENRAVEQVVLRNVKADFIHLHTDEDENMDLLLNYPRVSYELGSLPHRLTLLTRSTGKCHVRLELNHAMTDCGSFASMMYELALAYDGQLSNTGHGFHYKDFVKYIYNQPSTDNSRAYWEKYLDGSQPSNLGCLTNRDSDLDNTRTEPRRLMSTTVHMPLSAHQMSDFCRTHEVTVFHIFQAAWGLVLSSYLNSNDVCFGYSTSGRDAPLPSIETAVGTFINTLICRVTMDNSTSVLAILEEIKARTTMSLDHQHYWIPDIQNVEKPQFNTIIAFQKAVILDREKTTFQVQQISVYDPSELEVAVIVDTTDPEATLVKLDYWDNVLDPEYAQYISEAFTMALNAVVASPEKTIRETNLLSQGMMTQIREFNSPAPVRRVECLHDIFRQCAQESSSALALFSTKISLTYGQVDSLSNRLSNYLIDLGIAPEVRVALCFEKSVWVVVSMLAVWKAGGCVVAFDPAQPKARISMLLENVSAALVLTSREISTTWNDSFGTPSIIVSEDAIMEMMHNDHAGSTSVQPNNAAYINFTSGTTGMPKGAVIEHFALLSNVEPLARASSVDSHTRALQFGSYAFDVIYWETVIPLLSGGCVCIASDYERYNDLSGFIARANINWACLTPSFARLLRPSDVPTLKVLILVGEAMSAGDITRWSKSVVLKNGYGPCECTPGSTVHPDMGSARSTQSIGWRLGQSLWVVDPENYNRLVPIGAIGELLLGGPQVGRGYINHPEMTDEAFVKSPTWFNGMFTDISQAGSNVPARFYRTGDLVRANSDGSIDFLGRKDHDQVKLRGQRIQLNEVEHCVLANMATVNQATATIVTRENNKYDDQVLALFLQLSPIEDSIDSGTQKLEISGEPRALDISDAMFTELKHLANAMMKTLPSFMVPSLFVPVTHMPLNSSTKIDRRALVKLLDTIPEAELARYSLVNFPVEKHEPTTPLAKLLHGLVSEILATSISIDDNFFQRGGDSLKAMALVSAARRSNVVLAVVDIFNNPTISELAKIAAWNDAGTIVSQQTEEVKKDAEHEADRAEALKLALEHYKMKESQIQDMYPCTGLQDAMLALSQNHAGSYLFQLVTEISDDADLDEYLDAWKAVRRNNDILRTRIINTQRGGYQVIYNDRMVFRNRSASTLEDYLNEDKQKPMDYGDELVRFSLVTADNDKQYLICTLHHALYDGWSLQLILSQIEQACQWKPLTRPPPFADYARFIQNQDRAEADRFWLAQLSGAPTCDFPSLPSPGYHAHTGELLTRWVPLTQQRPGTDLAAAVKAAWAILLSKFSGSSDVVFASTNSGRTIPLDGIMDMVGPTITTVPLRVQIGDQTVQELVGDVCRRSLSMIPYEYIGLQNIRTLGHDCEAACDLRTLLVLQPGDFENPVPIDIPGVRYVPLQTPDFFTYPLVVECYMGRERLRLDAYFDKNVVDNAEANRLMAQLDHLINQLLLGSNNNKPIRSIDLISPEDRRDIYKWNSKAPLKKDACVHTLFGERVAEHPAAVAVEAWDATMTYQELDELSTRLAAYLTHEAGVKPESLVPLSFEKSAWAIVAMLGIVKAGGAFVFMDPKLPEARKSFIMKSTKSSFVLGSVKQMALWTDSSWQKIEVSQEAIHKLPEDTTYDDMVGPDNLLYVIYTSGSTGVPKGCLMEHSAFLSSVYGWAEKLDMDRNTRALQFSSYSFDVSTKETLAVLVTGGCICIPSEHAFEAGIVSMVQECQANWASLTPSVAGLVQQPSDVPNLRTLVLLGEPCTQRDIKLWSESLNLVNAYGLTEAAVSSVVNEDITATTDAANIGYGSGCLTWIVDPDDANILLPVGCQGELLVQGPTLARGYLNQPDTTAAKFVSDLAWAEKGSRFYRSGDLASYNPDGSINYLGRRDYQVKLRGQRIELGEIEESIVKHKSLSADSSCVLIPKSGPYANKLTAVVVLADFSSTTDVPLSTVTGMHSNTKVAEMRDALSEVLPVYMIPETWILVSALPLSSTGKRDRKKITAWVQSLNAKLQEKIDGLVTPDILVMPQGDAEKQLQSICCDVLNIPPEKAGMNRSFISLGGDSITAMRLVSKCRNEGISISLGKITSRATLSELARSIGDQRFTGHDVPARQSLHPPTSSVSANDQAGDFDLTPIQEHYMTIESRCTSKNTIDHDFCNQHRFHQSFFLRVTRPVDTSAVSNALRYILKRHAMLRAVFSPISTGGWKQSILPYAATDDAHHFWISDALTTGQITSVIDEATDSLNIRKGPVFRAVLFEKGVEGRGQSLFLTAHHLVIDLVSWRVIIDELEQLLLKPHKLLSSLTSLSFRDWAIAQDSYSKEELPPVVALPAEVHPSKPDYWGITEFSNNTYGETVCETFDMDKEWTNSLVVGKGHDTLRTDVVDVLLASVIRAFASSFPDRDTPTIYVEGHGREPWDDLIDISSTVGWFTTISPVHVSNTQPSEALLQTLRRTKDTRRRLPGNGWSYFASRYLNTQGQDVFHDDTLAEVVFNYAGQYQQLEKSNGLFVECEDVTLCEVGSRTPRFALIEISAVIKKGQLHMSFTFNKKMRQMDLLSDWVEKTKGTLRLIVDEMSAATSTIPTLSDFPLLRTTTYEDMESIISHVNTQLRCSWGNIEDIFPCSPLQTAILLSNSVDNARYRTSVVLQLESSSQHTTSESVQLAWTKVVARHPALRTVFVETRSTDGAGVFKQLVLKSMNPSIEILEAEDEEIAMQTLRSWVSASFLSHLGNFPHSLAICRIPASSRVLCKLEISHAVQDGLSMQLIYRDLMTAMSGQTRGSKHPSYSGYISYLQKREHKQSESLKYWTKYLYGAIPCHFPLARVEGKKNTAKEGEAGHCVHVHIPEHLPQLLDRFAKNHTITPASVIQAAWALVLRCYTQSEEVCFGYAVAGRDVPVRDIEEIVGPFINLLTCRLNLASDDCHSLLGVAAQIQNDLFESLPFQTCSLLEIQHEMKLSGRALFNTCVSVQRYSPPPVDSSSGLKLNILDSQDPNEFAIVLSAEYSADHLECILRCSPQEVSTARADSVAGAFAMALVAILSDPEQPSQSVDLFSTNDRVIVEGWNNKVPPTIDACVYDTIRSRAYIQPNAPAVCSSWEGEISYMQLEEYSNQLALKLARHHDVSPGMVVPLYFEKSMWVPVVMLAVLKAGASFMPLNTSDPPARVESLIRQVKASLILTSTDLRSTFDHRHTILAVSSETFTAGADSEPVAFASTTDAAYVLFTSGSTGKPKGVVVEHRAISSSIAQHGPVFGLMCTSRVLQFSAYTFDVSLIEILTTLSFGGCICVPSEEERKSDLEGTVRRMEANFMILTPSVAQILCPDNVPSLKTLVVGGEAANKNLVDTWSRRLDLISGYGPTEAAIVAAVGHLTSDSDPGFLGTPVCSQSWIADPSNHDCLAPIGSVGELVLSGPCLAREYLDDSEMTSKSFIESPAWRLAKSIGRIYKTGDLVSYNDDGTIVFRGRKTGEQIKINGQRVELGEIENHILSCLPSKSEVSVVVARSTNSSAQESAALRLVTFISISGFRQDDPNADGTADIAIPLGLASGLRNVLLKLRTTLVAKLPAYMVPSLYVPLATLPKSASGKSDRKAMIQIAQNLTKTDQELYSLGETSGDMKRQVSTEFEHILQGAWALVLGTSTSSIGADDHFFKLGGDSLSAMKLASDLRARNILISVTDILTHPILAEQANMIREKARDHVGIHEELDKVRPFEMLDRDSVFTRITECYRADVVVEDAYPCTPLQEALFAITQANNSAYVNRVVFKIPESVNIQRFQSAWETVYSLVPMLRTAIVNTQSHGACQVVYRQPIQWTDTSVGLQQYLRMDAQRPMTEGQPLTRYGLVSTEKSTFFVWTAHHAAYDAWMADLILDMVHQAYKGYSFEPPIPYTSFIKYLNSVNKDDAATYWRLQLEGYSRVDFPSTPSETYRAHTNRFVHDTIELPKAELQNNNVTLASLLEAAWALVVSLHTGSSDVVFGTTQSGRDAPLHGIERIAGPTISTVPMRIQIDTCQHVFQYLVDVHTQAAGMLPYQHTGIRSIKALGRGPEEACEFKSLLVVQAANEISENADWIAYHADGESSSLEDFINLPIVLECTPNKESGRVDIRTYFDCNVLSVFEAERIVGHFGHVVRQLTAADSQKKLSEIQYFTPGDHELVFDKWGASQPPTVFPQCLHSRFEEMAVLYPGSTAISSWDLAEGGLTYQELDKLATQLAQRLVGFGVQSGDLVPLCVEKSAWAVISMLAILKAGAAFVPLEPSHPTSRLQDMVNQTSARLIIASASAPALEVEKTLIVSPVAVSEWPTDSDKPLPPGDPNGTAYVIFTSGSTGRPKGVMVSHQAISSSAAMRDLSAMGIASDARIYQFASYIFDAAIFDIFAALSIGAVLCIPSEAERANLGYSMHQMGATTVLLTPTVSRLLEPDDVPALRTLIVGGEALLQKDVERWTPKVAVFQAYGPAEASIFVTWTHLNGVMANNIGPARHACLSIVRPDDHNVLSPVGLVGELLIGGPGLATGYLNDEQKTAAAFVSAPTWSHDRSSKFFKTGDLVHYANDGSLVFVGRKDDQVKLNGQRVEIGEIEAQLHSILPSTKLVVVFASSGPCKGLLAAVIPSPSSPNNGPSDMQLESDSQTKQLLAKTIIQMQDTILTRLPSYMVPRIWFVATELPLNTSGKLDRKLISQWVEKLDPSQSLQLEHEVTPTMPAMPANEIESLLQQSIGKVLNIVPGDVSLNKSFMNLGGDSISAMQLVAQLQMASNIAVNIRHILESRSIRQLAMSLKSSEPKKKYPEETPGIPFDLSPIQKRFISAIHPTSANPRRFNQSFLVRLTQKVSVDRLTDALDFVVARHSMLRARFHRDHHGSWTQTILAALENSYRMSVHDTTSDIGRVMECSQSSLDILSGPVFSVDVCTDVDTGRQLLFMVAHHLVVDLVSWRIILNELEEILSAEGGSERLRRNPPMSFQTWLALQHQEAQILLPGTVLSSEPASPPLDYWNLSPSLDMNTFGHVEESWFTLSSGLTSELLDNTYGSQLGTDAVNIILGALQHAFQQTFQDRFLPSIFLEGHGRESSWDDYIDISSTVGWFTTIVPISLDGTEVGDGDDVTQFIRSIMIRRQSLGNNGWSHFATHLLKAQERTTISRQSGPMEVLFNFAGRYQQLESPQALFQLEPRDIYGFETGDVGIDMVRPSIFDISCVVVDGLLRISFGWPSHLDAERHQQIRRWASRTEESLAEAIQALRREPKTLVFAGFPLLAPSVMTIESEGMVKDSLLKLGVADILGEVEDIYPTVPMQEGILVSRSIDSEAYLVETIFRISASSGCDIDLDRLEAAWVAVVQRHPSLRTVFLETATDLVQVVLKKLQSTSVRVACELDSEAVEMLAHQNLLQQETTVVKWPTPTGPARLFICHVKSSGTTFCKIAIDHAVADGASMGVLQRDLGLAYEGCLAPGHGFLYSDFLSYQINRNDREASLAYWSKYLDGLQPCNLGLTSVGVPRNLHEIEFKLSDISKMRAFSASFGVTLANTIQAAWAVVLRSFSNSDEICFGYLSSGRDVPLKGIHDAVGLFVNMLLSRVNFSFELSVADLLRRMHADYVGALASPSCSLRDMQRLAAAGSEQPLFDTIISYQQELTSDKDGKHSHLQFDQIGGKDPTEYALSIGIAASEEYLDVSISYCTDIISDSRAESIASSFEQAIKSLVDEKLDSKLPARDLPILGERDVAKIKAWNANPILPLEKCVHSMIEDQVKSQPDALAVCSTEVEWSYHQLDELATRLAHHLVVFGVGPGFKVPHCLDASPWAIVVMISILKAGGTSVALDPKHPVHRLNGIVYDLNATLLITSPHHATKFMDRQTPASAIKVLTLDLEGLLNPLLPLSSSLPAVQPTDLAFVNFTSGSTGKPKGILLEHRSICTSSSYYGRAMGYGAGSRALQFSSYTFDVSISDIFFSLMRGGTVCVPTEDEKLNDLAGFINRMNCNTTDLTPSVLEALLHPDMVPGLKTVCLGGEAVKQDCVSLWADRVALHNYYGPSECSVASVGRSNLSSETSASNIGVGCGALTWVVDSCSPRKLAPVGTVGELFLEGPLLARGYLQTSDKGFLQDISWPAFSRSRRLYGTGDLVRYNEDGSLDYLGRKDTQVKIRGQRVETAEIEHQAILQDCQLSGKISVEAVKISGRDTAVLAAFVSVNSNRMTTGAVDDCAQLSDELLATFECLRTSLAASLPSYMVPSLFIPLNNLPLNSSGKRDRRALQTIAAKLSLEQIRSFSLAEDITQRRDPSTETEVILRSIWSKILGLPESTISIDDDFFRLGGDSISAARVANLATKKYGISISTLAAMTQKTISRLAALADTSSCVSRSNEIGSDSGVDYSTLVHSAMTAGTSVAESETSKSFSSVKFEDDGVNARDKLAGRLGLNASNIEAIFPCTPAQTALLKVSKEQPESGYYHITQVFEVLSQNKETTLDSTRLYEAWRQVVDRHPTLRTRFVTNTSHGFSSKQVVLNKYEPKILLVKIQEDGEDLLSQGLDEGNKSASAAQLKVQDGASGPLHHMTIATTPSGRLLCRLDIHHSITDGNSIMTMFEDLERAYWGALPAGPAPYVRQFVRSRAALDKESAIKYWENIISTAGYRENDSMDYNVDSKPRTGLRELTTQVRNPGLQEICLAQGITMPSLIYAAWGLVLSHNRKSNHEIFAYLSNGRTLTPSSAVGFLVDTVPCHVGVHDNESFAALLQSTHDNVLTALPHSHPDVFTELGIKATSLVNVRKFDEGSDLLRELDGDKYPNDSSHISFKPIYGTDPMAYDIVLAVSELRGGAALDLTLAFWNSGVSETDANLMLSRLECILSRIGENGHLSCGELIAGLV